MVVYVAYPSYIIYVACYQLSNTIFCYKLSSRVNIQSKFPVRAVGMENS